MRLWFLISAIFMSNLLFASIEVTIKPQPAIVGEEVQLIVKQTGASSKHGVPDLSALSNDFQVVGTQQSMAYQLINGVSSHENIWTILLLPKHPGKLLIPALDVGGEQTTPHWLQVVNQRRSMQKEESDLSGKAVFLSWTFEPQKPLLNEEIKVKLRVYHQAPLLDAKLSPPQVENGLLFSIDQHQHLVKMVVGVKYEIEEYQYLIYPQKVGKLVISPPILDALEYDMMPKPVRATLPEKVLTILPQLGQDRKSWLPAKKISFEELTLARQKHQLALGDTVTRKIQLTTVGVPANVIPDIKVGCGAHCKAYIHSSNIQNKMVGDELWGSKTFEITYLPRQQGDIKVEPIRIPWFNTKTRQSETLEIPGVHLTVTPESNTVSSIIEPPSPSKTHWHIPSWLSLLLGLGLGMGCMKWAGKLKWRRIFHHLAAMEYKNHALQQACLKNDAAKTRVLIVAWAKKTFPHADIRDLHDICLCIGESPLKTELELLSTYLYGAHVSQASWHGKKLWKVFQKYHVPKKSKNKSVKTLNRLNP